MPQTAWLFQVSIGANQMNWVSLLYALRNNIVLWWWFPSKSSGNFLMGLPNIYTWTM